MNSLLSMLGPIFWGLVMFSVVVFVHEGGHYLAARACGVRVREFFLGLPCRYNLHVRGRRSGTKFGITPLLLGGYAEICGMEPARSPHAAHVLAFVHARGHASVAQMAEELGIDEDEALEAAAQLLGWGSLAAHYEDGERPSSRYYPMAYASVPRDAAGNTALDGRAFDAAGATGEGEPWSLPDHMDEEAFLSRERSRVYAGKGFWARALMLVAGIAMNIVTGFLLVVVVYSIIGVPAAWDVNVIGGVTQGSPAERAGLAAGDRIVSIDGADVDSWSDILQMLDGVEPGEEIELVTWRAHDAADAYEHLASDGGAFETDGWADAHGAFASRRVALDENGMLGIEVSQRTVHVDPLTSCQLAVSNIVETARGVAQLLVPSHTMEVLQNSTSVVGISVMSASAAAAGPASFLNLVALISFSLGFMNLLPIPPLDGGKLLIEAIQAITRREVPLKVQTAISLVGVALFILLFVFMLRMDIMRFF